METNTSITELTQFFDAIKLCDVQTVQTILKNHPTFVHETSPTETNALEEAIRIDMHSIQTNERRPILVKLLLKAGAQIKKTYLTHLLTDIQGYSTCKNQIAHLLFSFGAAMDSNDAVWYKDDPKSILRIWEREDQFKEINNKKLIAITQKHICTRLYIAIKEGNEDEVYRLVKKYNLAINHPLPCYFLRLDYGTPKASVDIPFTEIIPLHYAMQCNQDALVHMLINELYADVNATNKNSQTVLHYKPNSPTMEFLLSKSANNIHNQISIDENSEEVDSINLTNNNEISSEEIEDHVAMDSIDLTFADESSETEDYIEIDPSLLENNPSQQFEPIKDHKEPIHTITNKSGPDAHDNPMNRVTNNTMPWKWIGGGTAVIIVIIAAKKLYNWWHIKVEAQKENDSLELQSEQGQPTNILA